MQFKNLTDHYLLQNIDQLKDTPETHIKALISLLHYHNTQYYLYTSPVISDSQYDQLFDLLKSLEKQFPHYIQENSPTQRLVGQLDGFSSARHSIPLLSLQNTYNSEDIINREKTLKNSLTQRSDSQQHTITYCIEPKLDGNAVELIYINGTFHQAITRGDGNSGEDITQHARYLLNLPMKLQGNTIPEKLQLRGEIIMSKQAHQKLNEYQSQKGLPLFANSRNAVAGTLRNLNPNITQSRGLSCIVYDLLNHDCTNLSTHKEIIQQFTQRGLPTIQELIIVSSINKVIDFCNDTKTIKNLEKERYETDGLVIKINDISVREIVGTTNHHPKWAMAFKFPSKQVATKLLNVSFQIGRSGIITPVAELQEVALGGVKITRASLHNFEQIEKLDIRKGDQVWLQRSGEVIPYILGPITQQRDGTESIIQAPLLCPTCHNATQKDEAYIAIRCINTLCPAIIKQSLIHAVSKDCLDIKGLGESMIEAMVDADSIKNLADLFQLQDPSKAMILRLLPGFADKKIVSIMQATEGAKKSPFRRILHAFGITGVGIKTSQELEQRLANKGILGAGNILNALQNFQSTHIHGFGKELSEELQHYATQETTHTLWQSLEQAGVLFSPQTTETKQGIFTGKNIVITGTLDRPRAEIIGRIESQGGKIITGVTKKTSAILVGTEPGSKYDDAVKLQIPIYHSFEEMSNAFTQ